MNEPSYVKGLTAGECPDWVCEQLQEDLDRRDQRIAELEHMNYTLNEQSLGEKYRADQAEKRIAELEVELDHATLWNESVAVCARHVPDATQEGCVWCDLERAEAALREVGSEYGGAQ